MYRRTINYRYADILQALYESRNGLRIYTLYSRFDLLPSEALVFIRQYSNRDIIKRDEAQLSLTDHGRVNIRSIIADLIATASPDKYNYLSSIVRPRKQIYEPYVGSRSFGEYNEWDADDNDITPF